MKSKIFDKNALFGNRLNFIFYHYLTSSFLLKTNIKQTHITNM